MCCFPLRDGNAKNTVHEMLPFIAFIWNILLPCTSSNNCQKVWGSFNISAVNVCFETKKCTHLSSLDHLTLLFSIEEKNHLPYYSGFISTLVNQLLGYFISRFFRNIIHFQNRYYPIKFIKKLIWTINMNNFSLMFWCF